MIPDYFPVLTSADILPPGHNEYREGEQASTVGWLKELFLYGDDSLEYIQITPQDRKDYEQAVRTFKRVNNVAQSVDLHDYEETTTQVKQARALNKLRRELGYTEIQ